MPTPLVKASQTVGQVLKRGDVVIYEFTVYPGDKEHRLPSIKKVTSGSTPEVGQGVNALYADIITAGTHLASSIKVAESGKLIETPSATWISR